MDGEESAAAEDVTPRGSWVWRDPRMGSAEGREGLIASARELGLTELYVFVPLEREEPSLEDLAAFALLAQQSGLGLVWVVGDPSWSSPDGEQLGARALKKIARLRSEIESLGGTAPDRVQFDVEPHLLDGWASNERTWIVGNYVRLVQGLAVGCRALGLESWFVIPFWFEGIRHGGVPLHQIVTQAGDGIVVMAYRNQGSEVIEAASREIAYAESIGSRVVVAVETRCIEPTRVTYCHRGADALAEDVATIEEAFGQSPALEAIAVHDLAGLRDLLDRR